MSARRVLKKTRRKRYDACDELVEEGGFAFLRKSPAVAVCPRHTAKSRRLSSSQASYLSSRRIRRDSLTLLLVLSPQSPLRRAFAGTPIRKTATPHPSPHKPAKRLRGESEEQQNERTTSFIKKLVASPQTEAQRSGFGLDKEEQGSGRMTFL